MSAVVHYADVENVVKAWLLTTDTATLVARTGGHNIYLAMPLAAPVPSIVLSRVGGGPSARKDLPEDRARISFACWGATRVQATDILCSLIADLETLARTGGWFDGDVLLAAGEVTTVLWLPDPDSDKPRYIVDALVTTVST